MDTNEFDDADLYGDLPEFAGPQSDARVQQLEQHIEQLRSQVGSLCEEVRMLCGIVSETIQSKNTHHHSGIE